MSIQSPNESVPHWNLLIKGSESVVSTTTKTRCKVVNFEDYGRSPIESPRRHDRIADLVAKVEQDDVRKQALESARQWLAEQFDGEEATVRSLRLAKGWSQAKLAQEIGTSQPHIVRIEKGTENLMMSTVRKLAEALGVTLDSLNSALLAQEAERRSRS